MALISQKILLWNCNYRIEYSKIPILEYQQIYSKIGVIYEVFKNFGPMQKSIYQKNFGSISIPKSEFYYTPKKWKSTKPFIWARYQLRNSDIDNSFSKKTKILVYRFHRL